MKQESRNSDNPYFIMGLSSSATDQEIREAFHEFLRRGEANERIREAYTKIKDAAARRLYRYLDIFSYLEAPPEQSIKNEVSSDKLEFLAAELAFLSEWELGKNREEELV
ncbi:MAG: hypothetical protein ACI9S8_002907 [Chlamydiales bacterium]|jgi:DnaJ-class molecular chaperone